MLRIRRVFPLILMLALAGTAWAQNAPKVFSLSEAVDYSLQNSIAISNAQLDVADADAQIIERRAAGLPQANITGNYQYFVQLPTSLIPAQAFDPSAPADEFAAVQFGVDHNLTLGGDVSQLLFDGSYFVALQAAKNYKGLVAAQLQTAKVNLVNEVRNAYLPALIIDKNIGIVDKNLANLESLFRETKATFEAGFAEQLDVDRLELSIANLRTERENLLNQEAIVLNALKFQMGYPLDEPIELADDIEALLSEQTDAMLAAEINYNRRSELEVLNESITLNELNVKLGKAGYLPSLSAFGQYQEQMQANSGASAAWFPIGIVGLQLNVPVFDGFRKKAVVDRAEIGLAKANNDIRDFKRAVNLQVTNARINYLNAKRRVESQTNNVALAERIYSTTQIKYKEGVGSSIELSQAEQSLYSTQQNLLQAQFDLLQAQFALQQALGTVL